MTRKFTASEAAKYLNCMKADLLKWIEPDGRMSRDGLVAPPGRSGARYWTSETLDAAKADVEKRKQDRRDAIAEAAARNKALADADEARRKNMIKGGALLTSAVRVALGCTLTELDRWSQDGRLSPDGEIVIHGSTFGKVVYARAWLPATVDAAKPLVEQWRAQDATVRAFKRRGLRLIA